MNIRGSTRVRGQCGTDKERMRAMPTSARVCLGCGRGFESYGVFNRMCKRCRGKEAAR